MKKIIVLFSLCLITLFCSSQSISEIHLQSDSVKYDTIYDMYLYYQSVNQDFDIAYQIPSSLEKYYKSGEVCLSIGAASLTIGSITAILGLAFYIQADLLDKELKNSQIQPTESFSHYQNKILDLTERRDYYYKISDIHFITTGAFLSFGIPLTIVGYEQKKTADIIYDNLLW